MTVFVLYCSLHGYYPPTEVNKYISYTACVEAGAREPKALIRNMKCVCNMEKK